MPLNADPTSRIISWIVDPFSLGLLSFVNDETNLDAVISVTMPSTEKNVAGIMGISNAASPVVFGEGRLRALWK